MQRLPDVEVAISGCQQDGRWRDLFRPADAPQRQTFGLPGLPFVTQCIVEPGIDRPRRDGIDKDAVRRRLLRESTGEADHARLCGAVMCETWRTFVGQIGTDVDDAAEAARLHADICQLRQYECGA